MPAAKKKADKTRSSNSTKSGNEEDTEMFPSEDSDLPDDADERREQNIGNLVHFCLTSHAKKGVIKIEDIRKYDVVAGKPSSKAISELLEEAAKVLKYVFGMELCEKTLSDGKKPGVYCFRNLLKQEADANPEFDKLMKFEIDGLANKGLLITVLMFLFMSEPENCVTPEKHLLGFLERLGFEEKKEEEPFGKMLRAGNPQGGFLQEFVRSGWLETSKIQKSDPVEHEYRWGFRAKQCVDKLQLLELISKMYGSKTKDWSLHYDVARRQSDRGGDKSKEEDERMQEEAEDTTDDSD